MARGVADTSAHSGSAIRGLNCAGPQTANGLCRTRGLRGHRCRGRSGRSGRPSRAGTMTMLRQVAPLDPSAGDEQHRLDHLAAQDDRRRAAPGGWVEQVGHQLPLLVGQGDREAHAGSLRAKRVSSCGATRGRARTGSSTDARLRGGGRSPRCSRTLRSGQTPLHSVRPEGSVRRPSNQFESGGSSGPSGPSATAMEAAAARQTSGSKPLRASSAYAFWRRRVESGSRSRARR